MIRIYTTDFEGMAIVSNVVSFQTSEVFCGVGTFTLVVLNMEGDETFKGYLKNGNYLYDTATGFCGTIECVRLTKDTLIVNGYSLNWLLNTRVAMWAGKKPTANVEECVYSFLDVNKRGLCIEDRLAKGLAYSVDIQFEIGDKLGDVIANALAEKGLGYRVYIEPRDRKLLFEVLEGSDLTTEGDPNAVMFSLDRHNMKDIDGTVDTSEMVNAVIATAKFLTGTTLIAQVNSTNSTIPYREAYISVKDQQDATTKDDEEIPAETDEEFKARVNAECRSYLEGHGTAESFVFDVGSQDYGIKFQLGDLVYCRLEEFGLEFKTKVSEYRYSLDRAGENRTITLGVEKRRRLKVNG